MGQQIRQGAFKRGNEKKNQKGAGERTRNDPYGQEKAIKRKGLLTPTSTVKSQGGQPSMPLESEGEKQERSNKSTTTNSDAGRQRGKLRGKREDVSRGPGRGRRWINRESKQRIIKMPYSSENRNEKD